MNWAPIHRAVYGNKLDELRLLLEQKNSDVNARASDGRTALHIACAYTDVSVEIIRVLIEAGCDVRIQDNVYRDTALHLACRFENIDKVRLLIEAGSDIKVANIKNRTPLFYASKYGHLANVEALVAAGADVNSIDTKGYTCLMLVSNSYDPESTDDEKRNLHKITETLLQHGADANIVTQNDQFALILNMRGCCDYETFKLLFENTDRALIESNKHQFFEEVLRNCTSNHYDFFLMIEHLIHLNYIPNYLLVAKVLPIFHKICFQRESDLWERYECLFSSIFNKNQTLDKDVNLEFVMRICAIVNSNNSQSGLKLMNLLLDYGLNIDFKLLTNFLLDTFTSPEFFTAVLPFCISFEPWDINIALKKKYEREFPFMKQYEIYADKTKCTDLKSLCRIAIRKIMRNSSKCKNTRQFLSTIEALPIPETLKNYLRYK